MLKNDSVVRLPDAGNASAQPQEKGNCRFCGTQLQHVFVDLGLSPLANAYLKEEELSSNEKFFPLKAFRLWRVLPRPARGMGNAGEYLRRLCLLLVL